MWKAIGSVHSGDDRSIRSNRSREEVSFEHFRQHPANRSATLEPNGDRSFCFDYFQKKREGKTTLEKSRAKSEKNLRTDEANKQDMFTSMRMILGNEINDSRMTSKNYEAEVSKLPQSTQEKNDQIYKLALTRIKNLRKEQAKLKMSLSNEFTTFKNMFLQLEDVMHVYENRLLESPQDKSSKVSCDLEPDFVKDIVAEAMGIEKYFAEMERKKAGIMNQLSNK